MNTVAEPEVERASWALAAAFFGVGDVVTTTLGLVAFGVVEGNPTAAMVLDHAGLFGMVAAKVVVVAILFGIYAVSPRDIRFAVPVTLATVGTVIVGWNIAVIAVAAGIV